MQKTDALCDLELMKTAEEAMKKAYVPYSEFKVGAALIAADDSGAERVFQGCNIENSSYSPTMCAERVAAAEAVKNGYRRFLKIAICGGKEGIISDFCPPCGVCRQVLCEFGDDDAIVLLTDGKTIESYTFGEILPLSSRKDKLL